MSVYRFILIGCVLAALLTTSGTGWPEDTTGLHRTGLLYQKLIEGPGMRQVFSVAPASGDKDIHGPMADSLTAVDNSAGVPPVGNQGSQGSCAAWALGYYHLTQQIWREKAWSVTDPTHQMSPAFVYNHANGGFDMGAYPEDAMNLVVNHGCATMSDMPYSQSVYTTWPSESAYQNALQFRALSGNFIDVSTTSGLNALKQYVANGNTANLGIWVYSNFDNISSFGNIYTVADKYGTNRGGHAVTIVGYDDTKPTRDGNGAFRLVNSWGTGWGDAGWFWMSYKAVMSAELSFQQAWYLTREVGYTPQLIARFRITHASRGQIIRNGGLVAGVGNAVWSTKLFNFPIMQQYIEGIGSAYQAYAFPNNSIVVDLTKGAPYIQGQSQRRIYLSAKDSIAGTIGTINSFSAAYLGTPYSGHSSNCPATIPDNGTPVVVDLTIVTQQPGILTGFVRDTWNNPVAGATVVLTPTGKSSTSGPNGSYLIENVFPGSYEVVGFKSGVGAEVRSGVSISEGQTTYLDMCLVPTTSIGNAKALQNGASVLVSGIVSSKFPVLGSQERLYIQDANRSTGIAIATQTEIALGTEVLVRGVLNTSDGERILTNVSITAVGSSTPPKPLSMPNRKLGGGWHGLQAAVINNSASNSYSNDTNNIGLLVKSWGKVTYVSVTGGYFYMDDGSGLEDGSGQKGVRVICASLPTPSSGTDVRITGISGASLLGGKVIRVLRPRSVEDLSYFAEVGGWRDDFSGTSLDQSAPEPDWSVGSYSGGTAIVENGWLKITGISGRRSYAYVYNGKYLQYDNFVIRTKLYLANAATTFGSEQSNAEIRFRTNQNGVGYSLSFKANDSPNKINLRRSDTWAIIQNKEINYSLPTGTVLYVRIEANGSRLKITVGTSENGNDVVNWDFNDTTFTNKGCFWMMNYQMMDLRFDYFECQPLL